MTTDPTTTAPAAPDQLDLDAIAREWLVQCGSCDYGLVEYGCRCPSGDYRPVMLRLVDELRRLRGEQIEAREEAEELTHAALDERAEVRRLRAMLDLPDGIRWDLTRWRCDRCGTTSEWTGDDDPAAVDPVTAGAAGAHRHAADHQRWDAERQVRQATPPAGTGGERG